MRLLHTLRETDAVMASAVLRNILWLPLGDSITWGCGTDAVPRGADKCWADAGGYRVPLAWSLSQAGYNVSTMGLLHAGPEYVPAQWLRHEGHDEWRIDQIDGILDQVLASSSAPPDLVTIHLGTNDCYQNATPDVMHQRLQALLTHLFNAAPTATVFLASLIGFPRKAACVSAYNAALPAIVAERQRAGMKIVFTRVHEESGVCVGNTSDPRAGWCCAHMIHPTAAGYLRMASSFALAIAEHGWIVEETTGR